VPAALASGSIELRPAQAMSGPARDVLLQALEPGPAPRSTTAWRTSRFELAALVDPQRRGDPVRPARTTAGARRGGS
jgi:hypothetical protein